MLIPRTLTQSFLCASDPKAEGENPPRPDGDSPLPPTIEDYATIEAWSGGYPVYAFDFHYVYGVSPDIYPGAAMQKGNAHPARKIIPRKSWELSDSLCGCLPSREPRSRWNDDHPLRPIHLIDGDPETAWASQRMAIRSSGIEDQEEWVRIDLPVESMIASVALVCCRVGPHKDLTRTTGWVPEESLRPGKALPGAVRIELSRNGEKWTQVYDNPNFTGDDSGPNLIRFDPARAKQIRVTMGRLPFVQNFGRAVSLSSIEARDPDGDNLALVSRGAGVSVSSSHWGYERPRLAVDTCWPLQYDVGFKWARVGVDMGTFTWAYVEREKGKLQVDPKSDAAVSELVRNGVKVIMCLDKGNWLYNNPPRKLDWKRCRATESMSTYQDHPGWPSDSPEMLEGYLRYVDYMARRFKGRVAMWELCNEWEQMAIIHRKRETRDQGLDMSWRHEWEMIAPDDYLRIVDAAIPVIRRADPDARVMLGSVGGSRLDLLLECLKSRAGKPDLGPQLDCIGWHHAFDPINPDFRTYRGRIEKFKKDCAALGFTGTYCAAETYWFASYPPGSPSEIQRAKGAARELLTHLGLDVLSLTCETLPLLREVPAVSDPLPSLNAESIYYVLRTICTAMDGFRSAPLALEWRIESGAGGASDAKEVLDCYTFRHRESGDRLIAVWTNTPLSDEIVERGADLDLPGLRVRAARVIDLFSGTEQQLNVADTGAGSTIARLRIKDYPVLIRVETGDGRP